jgi:hypothetical protein
MTKKLKTPKIVPIKVKFVSDELAEEISELSDAMQILTNSKLSERALLLLLKDATGLGLGDIKRVMHALPNLKNWYLK